MPETEHPHTHRLETECAGEDCDRKRSEVFTHTHDDGHVAHVHPPEVVTATGETVSDRPEPSRSPTWFGPGTD
jgi:hypothetical protein